MKHNATHRPPWLRRLVAEGAGDASVAGHWMLAAMGLNRGRFLFGLKLALTPALSPEEREKRSQRFRTIQSLDGSDGWTIEERIGQVKNLWGSGSKPSR